MVLIFSQSLEFTTQKVIDWLTFFNIDWLRINEDDEITIEYIDFSTHNEPEIILKINQEILNLKEVKSYWFRRGMLNIQPKLDKIYSNNPKLNYQLRKHVNAEVENLGFFIFWYHTHPNFCSRRSYYPL